MFSYFEKLSATLIDFVKKQTNSCFYMILAKLDEKTKCMLDLLGLPFLSCKNRICDVIKGNDHMSAKFNFDFSTQIQAAVQSQIPVAVQSNIWLHRYGQSFDFVNTYQI